MAADSEESGTGQRGFWSRPRTKWLLGIPLGGFFAFGLGMAALGTMNYAIHETSTNEFCFSCHSHEVNIRPEYEASSHFNNTAGVRADCADCHLPKDNWFELTWTKAVVSLDIIPEMMGELSTPAKYDAHRPEMAEAVWEHFRDNDSKFCRNCHSIDAMDLESQERRTARRHSQAEEKGQTCIQCHYGIVHKLPENAVEIIDRVFADTECPAGGRATSGAGISPC
jgi:nitrate/TMAO reductase-like tetraheme cytochrome c subunit